MMPNPKADFLSWQGRWAVEDRPLSVLAPRNGAQVAPLQSLILRPARLDSGQVRLIRQQSHKLFEIPCGELRTVVGNDSGPFVREFLQRPLNDDFHIDLLLSFPQFVMRDVFPTQPDFVIRDIRLDGDTQPAVRPGSPPVGDTLIVNFSENVFTQLPSSIGPTSGRIRLDHDNDVLDILFVNFKELFGNLDLSF